MADLRDPSHPKSPYNRYNYDSPYSVTNPDSSYYDPTITPPEIVLIAVFFIPGLLFTMAYIFGGPVTDFVDRYTGFMEWHVPTLVQNVFLALTLPLAWGYLIVTWWKGK